MDVSIIHGPVPVLVTFAGPVALAAALWPRPKRFVVRTLPFLAGFGLLAAGMLAFGLNVTDTITDHYPPTYLLWGAGLFFSLVLAVAGWPTGTVRQRICAIVAVPLMLLFLMEQMNLHYAYYPTLGDALGKPRAGEVSADVLFERINRSTTTGVETSEAPTPTPTTRFVASELDVTIETTTPPAPTTTYDVASLPKRGQVTEVEIPSPVSGFKARKAWIYLPPAYFATPRPDLPVMMMLAGAPGQPKNWFVAASADKTADIYAAAHNGVAPIMVLPDPNGGMTEDTECVDGPRGKAETYLTVDVPKWVTDNLQTKPPPKWWGIAGLSEGGTCALVLALRHPDLFSLIGDYSGDLAPNLGNKDVTISELYAGDASQWEAHDPIALMGKSSYKGMRAWFEAGTAESKKLEGIRATEQAAARAGMTTRLMVTGGAHNFLEWAQAWRNSLPWVMEQFGVVAPDPATVAGTTTSA